MPRRKHPASPIITLIFLAVATFVLFLERDPGVRRLSPLQTAYLLDRDSSVVVIDVRTPEEWNGESGHLHDALLIPLSDLPGRLSELEKYRSHPLVVYCRSGSRSGRAARLLSENGFDASNMIGGIRQWNASGYQVIREHIP